MENEVIVNVLFLFEKGSKTEVFAYFPNKISHGEYRVSYSHIGQHGDCHPDYASECIQVPYRRHKALLMELNEIGYNVNILNEF